MQTDNLQLPASPDAERSILGAIVLENSLFAEAVQIVGPEAFFLDSHRRIFAAMATLTDESKPIDILTLSEELGRRKEIEAVGGVAYLSSLTDGALRRSSVKHHLKIIQDKAILRSLVHACNSLISQSLDGQATADELVELGQESMRQLAAQESDDMQWIHEFTDETLKRLQDDWNRTSEYSGFPLGISNVDQITGGVKETEVMLIGGRPGSGKTYALIQAAIKNSRHIKIVFFSLEMKRWQVLYRIWQHIAKTPTAVMRDKRMMNVTQRQDFKSAAVLAAELPIKIYDRTDLTVEKLQAKAAMAVMRDKAQLAIVDYGQLLTAKGKDEVERATKQARALDRLAKDYCPVLAALQLSRAPNHDPNKLPNMQDLKGSSQWEQDADIIALIHRPRMENDPTQMSGEDLMILEKMRESDGAKVEPIVMTPWAEWIPRYIGKDMGR